MEGVVSTCILVFKCQGRLAMTLNNKKVFNNDDQDAVFLPAAV